MLDLLRANLPTILAGAIVAAIFIAVAAKLIYDRLHHKSACSCGCSGCPCAGACHSKQ